MPYKALGGLGKPPVNACGLCQAQKTLQRRGEQSTPHLWRIWGRSLVFVVSLNSGGGLGMEAPWIWGHACIRHFKKLGIETYSAILTHFPAVMQLCANRMCTVSCSVWQSRRPPQGKETFVTFRSCIVAALALESWLRAQSCCFPPPPRMQHCIPWWGDSPIGFL